MSDPSGVRILIVDDDPRQARALSESLRAFGYETAAVDTGAAALDVMRQDPHDILLSDLVMPGMGGVERCWRRRRSIRTSSGFS